MSVKRDYSVERNRIVLVPYVLGACRTLCRRSTWAGRAGSPPPDTRIRWRGPGAEDTASSRVVCRPAGHGGVWPACGWSVWAENTRRISVWRTPCSTPTQCGSRPRHTVWYTAAQNIHHQYAEGWNTTRNPVQEPGLISPPQELRRWKLFKELINMRGYDFFMYYLFCFSHIIS